MIRSHRPPSSPSERDAAPVLRTDRFAPLRRMRWRSGTGTAVDGNGLWHGLLSVATMLPLLIAGHRVALPYISFRATRRFRGLLTHRSRVLEFGSGMSTLWFARHCGELVSFEADPGWYRRVTTRLRRQSNIAAVDYRLHTPAEVDLGSDLADESFDLVLVDGTSRPREIIIALMKVKPGGYIYLDNTDVDLPGNQLARAILIQATPPQDIETFTDFTPCRLFATEGMLATNCRFPFVQQVATRP